MAVEAAVDVISRYYREVWDGRNGAVIPELFAPSYKNHAGSRGILAGPAGIQANFADLTTSFPDVQFTLDDIITEGDKVVVRYTMRGTHTGTFQGIPATGRPVCVPGIGIYKVADGQIQESWVVRDSLSLLRQIGEQPA